MALSKEQESHLTICDGIIKIDKTTRVKRSQMHENSCPPHIHIDGFYDVSPEFVLDRQG